MSEKFTLDIPKIGYFLVYKKQKGNLFHRLIQKAQFNSGFEADASEYTHVEVSGGGQWAVSAQFPLSKIVDIRKIHKNRYVKIMSLKKDNYYDKGRYKLAWFAASKTNLPYGFWSLFWFKFKKLVVSKSNFLASASFPFCSFLCAWAIDKVYPGSIGDPKGIMPAEFVDTDKFNLVWEGVIN